MACFICLPVHGGFEKYCSIKINHVGYKITQFTGQECVPSVFSSGSNRFLPLFHSMALGEMRRCETGKVNQAV